MGGKAGRDIRCLEDSPTPDPSPQGGGEFRDGLLWGRWRVAPEGGASHNGDACGSPPSAPTGHLPHKGGGERRGAIFKAAIVLSAALCLLPLTPLRADDPPDLDQLPRVSRGASTRAFQAGGEIERLRLEAERMPIPGAADNAVELGSETDAEGNPTEVHFRLEIAEVQEEVYPGEYVTFWVFAPLGRSMGKPARLPSPTLRVQQGDRVKVTLYNTHYLPHTIHFHGLSQSWDMDGAPDMPHPAIGPGKSFTYEFIAKEAGTYFYHCHVHEHAHVPLGLGGMFIVEPRRPNNRFARLVSGAGRIEVLAKGTAEEHNREYSLVLMDIDDRLNRIVAAYGDPREIERRVHRDYDSTQRKPSIFLLNGRAFPFTLRDTPILVGPEENVKLRVLNMGGNTVHLHTHGHHPELTDLDGRSVSPAARVVRDTHTIGPAQRVDLNMRTGNDPRTASGPGVWMMHDHTPAASSNKGIGPGGTHTMIVYEGFMGPDGMPKGHAHHADHMKPEYYQGKVPVFDPKLFDPRGTAQSHDAVAGEPAGGAFDYPRRRVTPQLPRLNLIEAERHRVVAEACGGRARGFQRIVLKAGRAAARKPGEVFAFEPREIRAERCQEVEIVLENADEIRHDLMIPGLAPMFALNVLGPGTASARFITPDEDVTLPFHCHLPAHDKVGMNGQLIVGKGGAKVPVVQVQASGSGAAKQIHEGVGVVIATIPRQGRLVVDHEAIKGFMAAMEMSYPVAPPSLLDGLKSGDKIRFTIDAGRSQIIDIKVFEPAK